MTEFKTVADPFALSLTPLLCLCEDVEESEKLRPTVTEVLQRYYPAYEKRMGESLCPNKVNVLQLLVDCQTKAMGGHWWECQDCQHKHRSFNSCRNRHCSRCTKRARDLWLERVMDWVVPVNYFHCVFTTPHELNPLIDANERAFYKLQFRATAKALVDRAADPEEELGGVQPGFQMLLHTWGQLMLRHVHTHVVVLGGGLRLEDGDGGQKGEWVSSGKEFFLDEERLANKYRDAYLKMLRKLYRWGKLSLPGKLAKLKDPKAFAMFCESLAKRRWVIHTGAPEHCKHPAAALKYLSRYVVGAVISDHRIVSDIDGQVTIRYKDYRQGKKGGRAVQAMKTMPGEEFVERYAMHILPVRFPRTRYGGFLTGPVRKTALKAIREKVGEVEPPPVDNAPKPDVFDGEEDEFDPETDYPCVKCGARSMKWMAFIEATRGMASYTSLLWNTLPRCVRDRLKAESDLAIAEYRAELAEHDAGLAERQAVKPP